MNIRLYNGYLVLHDRDTRKKIKNPYIDEKTLEDLYIDELDNIITTFKQKFNQDIIILDNRVCVDDNDFNRNSYHIMRSFALKLEDQMVKKLNSIRQYQIY